MRILWIPHASWHIPQRAHLFCRALAEKHEVHVTNWVADFTQLRDYLSRRFLNNFYYHRYRDGNITVHGIPRISPALPMTTLRLFNMRLYSRFVRYIIQQYRIDVVVGTFVVPPPKAPRLIFDLFDDNVAYWREYGHNPNMAKEIAEIEAAWVSASDHVVVVSSVLRDKLESQFGPAMLARVAVIPNGINLQRYRSANGQHVRSSLGLGRNKAVGFISSFGSFSGLFRYLYAIQLLTDPAIIHLIVGNGSLLPKAKVLADRLGLSNVIFTGQVAWSEVADYYAAIDLGVIPFDLSEFTHSACPIKLLEYVACGKPVVSTPLEEVKRMGLPEVTFAGPEIKSFSDGITRALNSPKSFPVALDRYDMSCFLEEYEKILQG